MTRSNLEKVAWTDDAMDYFAHVAATSRQIANRVQFPRDGTDEISVEEWLSVRKAAALKIVPQTAEVTWCWGLTLDPYGVRPDLPEELQYVGREYFARAPESEVWVSFGDLPEATFRALTPAPWSYPPA